MTEFVAFAVPTIPKADITKVEITHSIKETERKLHNPWHQLGRKKDPHSLHNVVWVLVSMHQLLQKNQNRRFTL